MSTPHALLGSKPLSGLCEVAAFSSFSNAAWGRAVTNAVCQSYGPRVTNHSGLPWKFSSTREGVTLFGKTTVYKAMSEMEGLV